MKSWISLLSFVVMTVFISAFVHAKSPNVLFIAIDDLRPEIGCYGASQAVTPNIDQLAKQGILFEHAYCNIAVCGASRASILKGLRPTAKRFRHFDTWAEQDAPEVPSLPLTFKRHGYYTISNGKIYHKIKDDAKAWSEPAWHCKRPGGWWALPENRKPIKGYQRGPAFESAEVADKEYPDHQICEKTIHDLRKLVKQEKPFFLACGFHRPHLPFVVPKKYWDKHPSDQITLPDNMYFPKKLSQVFQYRWGELRAYRGIPKKGPVSKETALKLIQGYRASVSFVDAQVGRLLAEVERLGIAENTIIVLWSDHGWQLGEHSFWCKHTNFEVATHIPLIIVTPGVEGNQVCSRLVEGVDLYPTLCDLAKLPKPKHLQGKSLQPLLHNVEAKFKDAIITRYGSVDAVRTENYRYMEMRAKRGAGKLLGVGLFDLRKDLSENHNIAIIPKERFSKSMTEKQSLENSESSDRLKARHEKIEIQKKLKSILDKSRAVTYPQKKR